MQVGQPMEWVVNGKVAAKVVKFHDDAHEPMTSKARCVSCPPCKEAAGGSCLEGHVDGHTDATHSLSLLAVILATLTAGMTPQAPP